MSSLLSLLTVFTATFATPFAQAQPVVPPPRLPADVNYLEYTIANLNRAQFSTDPVELAQLTREGKVASSHDFQGVPQIEVFVRTFGLCRDVGQPDDYVITIENKGEALADINDIVFSFGSDQELVSANPAPRDTISDSRGNSLIWYPQDLAPDGGLVYTVKLRSVAEAEQYTVNAFVNYFGPNDNLQAPSRVSTTEHVTAGSCINIDEQGQRDPKPAILCEMGWTRDGIPAGEFIGDPLTNEASGIVFGPLEEGCEPTLKQLLLGPRFKSAQPAKPDQFLASDITQNRESVPGVFVTRFDAPVPDVIPGDCRVATDDYLQTPATGQFKFRNRNNVLRQAFWYGLQRRSRPAAYYSYPFYEASEDLKTLTEMNYLDARTRLQEAIDLLEERSKGLGALMNRLQEQLVSSPGRANELQELFTTGKEEMRAQLFTELHAIVVEGWRQDRLENFAQYVCDSQGVNASTCQLVLRSRDAIGRACSGPPDDPNNIDGHASEIIPYMYQQYAYETKFLTDLFWINTFGFLVPNLEPQALSPPLPATSDIEPLELPSEDWRKWLGADGNRSFVVEAAREQHISEGELQLFRGQFFTLSLNDDMGAIEKIINEERSHLQQQFRIFYHESGATGFGARTTDEQFRRDFMERVLQRPRTVATDCEVEQDGPRGFGAPTENSVEFPSSDSSSVSYCESGSPPSERTTSFVRVPPVDQPENSASFRTEGKVQRGDKAIPQKITQDTSIAFTDTHTRLGSVCVGETGLRYPRNPRIDGITGPEPEPLQCSNWQYSHPLEANTSGNPFVGSGTFAKHVETTSVYEARVGQPPGARHFTDTSEIGVLAANESLNLSGGSIFIDFATASETFRHEISSSTYANVSAGSTAHNSELSKFHSTRLNHRTANSNLSVSGVHARETSNVAVVNNSPVWECDSGEASWRDVGCVWDPAEPHNTATSLYWQIPLASEPTEISLYDKFSSYELTQDFRSCSGERGQAWWAPDCSCDCGQLGLYLDTAGDTFETGTYCVPGEGFYTSRGTNVPAEFPIQPGYNDYELEQRLGPGGESFIYGPDPVPAPPAGPQSSVLDSRLLAWLEPLTQITLGSEIARAAVLGEGQSQAENSSSIWTFVKEKMAALVRLLGRAIRIQVFVDEADIGVDKIDEVDPVAVGNILPYSINVYNFGPDEAVNVVLTDVLPPEVRVVKNPDNTNAITVPPGDAYCEIVGQDQDGLGGTITCKVGRLINPDDDPADGARKMCFNQPGCPTSNVGAQAARIININIKVEVVQPGTHSCGQNKPENDCLVNTASVKADTKDFEPNPEPDRCFANGKECVKRTGTDAKLKIEKSDDPPAGPDPVPVGEQLVYVLKADNTDEKTAEDVVVRDTLPASFDFFSSAGDADCTPEGFDFELPEGNVQKVPVNQVWCNFGDIAGGTSKEVDLTVKPTEPGEFTNHMHVSATWPGYNNLKYNNAVFEQTTVIGEADLEVRKEDDDDDGPRETDNDDPPDKIALGAALTYTIEVENKGPHEAKDVKVVDTLPSQPAGVVPPGENAVSITRNDVCEKILDGDRNVDPALRRVVRIECNVPEIRAGGKFVLQITFRPAKTGLIKNSVVANSEVNEDPDEDNNSDDETTEVVGGEPGGGNKCPPGAQCGPHNPATSLSDIGGGPGICPPGAICKHFRDTSRIDTTDCTAGTIPTDDDDDGINETCREPAAEECPAGTQPVASSGQNDRSNFQRNGNQSVAFPCVGRDPAGNCTCFDANNSGDCDDGDIFAPGGGPVEPPVPGPGNPPGGGLPPGGGGEAACCIPAGQSDTHNGKYPPCEPLFTPDPILPNLLNPPDDQRILWHDIFITSQAECLASFQGEHQFNRFAPTPKPGSLLR